MPRSNMSKFSMAPSVHDSRLSAEAARLAKESAQEELNRQIRSGLLRQPSNPQDHEAISAYMREYQPIYKMQYYKFYAQLLQQSQILEPTPRIIYVENPAATRYLRPHTVINFSRTNHFIRNYGKYIRVGRINFLLEGDIHTETKEAFLSAWPGPLDRTDNPDLKHRVTGYIDTLCQGDVERQIRYCNTTNDDHRKIIIRLLTKLLHMNGSIDAPGTTDLLLDSHSTEIQRDESNRNPLKALQKLLLRGKRAEAVKLAKDRKLWDHAQCLAFLHKYQPGPNAPVYQRDNQGYSRLRDDILIELNSEYINSMDESQKLLSIVYSSLLNRILQSDPESASMVKNHNVGNNFYEFALLSANDCDLEYDQTNELFRLILAVKRARIQPEVAYNHIISLGYSSLDSYDPGEELFAANRSYISFNQGDTPTSKTLIISNMDLLILNEIWEYCLNLAAGTSNSRTGYKYIVNLIPYKLVFASKLLDYGLYEMFQLYLNSLEHALYKGRCYQAHDMDPDYDWETIQQSVHYLRGLWAETFSKCPELLPRVLSNNNDKFIQLYSQQADEVSPVPLMAGYDQPPQPESHLQDPMDNYGTQIDHVDYSKQQDYSIPYQRPPPPPQPPQVENLYNNYNNQQANNPPPPAFSNSQVPQYSGGVNSSHWQTQEGISDFNPDPDPESEPLSTLDNQGGESGDPYEPVMTSSSPNNSRRESTQSHGMGQSFANAFSPIEPPIVDDPYDDVPRPRYQQQQQQQQQHHQQQPSLPPAPPFLPQPSRGAPPFNSIPSGNHNQEKQQQPQPSASSNDSGMNSVSNTNRASGGVGANGGSSTSNNNKTNDNNKTGEDGSQQQSDDQQGGLLSNFIGTAKSLIPRTNSKLFMSGKPSHVAHLPDDREKKIIFDEKLQQWVDTDPEAKEQSNVMDNYQVVRPKPGDPEPVYSAVSTVKSKKRFQGIA